MKKPLIKLFLLVLSCSFLAVAPAQAQYKLLLTEVQIKTEAMEKFERFADKQANIASDLPISIPLYKDNELTYYTCFHLTERGKKYRLVNHDYVVYNDERHKGKRQVLKYKKQDNIRGRITGVSEQDIEFNPELGRSIRMVYRFELVLEE